MASIIRVGTALPEHAYSRDEIVAAGNEWLGRHAEEAELFARFIASSKIERRCFAITLPEILAQAGMQERAERFIRHGLPLAERAARDALKGADGGKPDTLIFTSCSAPIVPSLDCPLVDRLELDRAIRRIPIYQYGCAGGAAGLALAGRLAGPEGGSLLVSAELCSLVYQREDLARGNLVGAALFGDGAAAVYVGEGPGQLRFLDSSSHLLPESQRLMGYDLRDDGSHLRLDRELPQILKEALPDLLERFLGRSGRSSRDIGWWLFHPGGTKILKGLEEALGIDSGRSRFAWDVLAEYGNMSSASILFVFEAFLSSGVYSAGDLVVSLGIGPGLTIELLLLECE